MLGLPNLDPALLLLLGQGDGFVRDPADSASSCVADNDTICFGWAFDNIGDYVTPTLEHLLLVGVSVAAGLAIAMFLAVVSYRNKVLVPAIVGATGIIYTIPSIALFLLLLPITGRGTVTALIALTLYTLQIIYRNIVTGLSNVPDSAREAGRGMGMTDRQLLWKVEMPLAVPEIIAGVRIATVSTVAIATLAVFAGAGGLGEEIYGAIQEGAFKTGIVIPSVLAIMIALIFDALCLLAQRLISPWRTVRPV